MRTVTTVSLSAINLRARAFATSYTARRCTPSMAATAASLAHARMSSSRLYAAKMAVSTAVISTWAKRHPG
jgi:hypothetical protein